MKPIYYAFLLLCSGMVYSQTDTTLTIEEATFDHLLENEFAKIFTPKTGNGIGNYASYDVVESKANFSGNFIMKDFNRKNFHLNTQGDVLSINASGGNSDGVVGLFSNTKWNNNIGFDIQYNMFNRSNVKGNYISVYADDYQSYIRQKALANKAVTEIVERHRSSLDSATMAISNQKRQIVIDSLKLQNTRNKNAILSYELDIKSKKVQTQKITDSQFLASAGYTGLTNDRKKEVSDSLTHTMNLLNGIVLQAELLLKESKNTQYKDSITLKASKEKLISLTKDSVSLSKKDLAVVQNTALIKRNTTNAKLLNDIPVIGFKMRWVSFGYGASNNSFRRLDLTRPFSQQLSRDNFLTQEVRLQYNVYTKGINEENRFFSIWAKGSITDNFSELSKTDFEETSIDTSGIRARKTTQKYSAYSGDYKKGIQQFTVGFDYYQFLTGGAVAFHLFPKWITTENMQPQLNIGFGLLMPFKNLKKDNELMNAELFMDATNMFKTNNETESDLFKRSSYGIRFTVPLYFKN